MSKNTFDLAGFSRLLSAVQAESSKAGKADLIKAYVAEQKAQSEENHRAACNLLCALIDPNVRFKQTWTLPMGEVFAGDDYVWLKDPARITQIVDSARSGVMAAEIADRFHDAFPGGSAGWNFAAKVFNKGIKIGVSEKTLATLIPGYVDTFDVMLAHKFEEKRVRFPCAVEPKIDGMRALVVIPPGVDFSAQFFTRSGKEIPSLSKHQGLQKELEQLSSIAWESFETDGLILDCEAITEGSFNDLMSELRQTSRSAEKLSLVLFDVLPIDFLRSSKDQWGLAGTAAERRVKLQNLMAEMSEFDGANLLRLNDRYFANSLEEIYQIYESCRERGLEGVIVKDLNAPYERKRSYSWMKIKPKETADLTVIGAFEGAGRLEGTLGGLIVDFNGVEVRVGSGFADDQRTKFWNMFQEDLRRLPESHRLLGTLVEVSYMEMTEDGSLRHPVFERRRTDKTEVNF